jgi:hypothetical protein
MLEEHTGIPHDDSGSDEYTLGLSVAIASSLDSCWLTRSAPDTAFRAGQAMSKFSLIRVGL